MGILLIILHLAVCFILISVILLQGGRGQGLSGSGFGGGGVQTLFGTRAADFLTKATSAAAILFLFTCIGLDVIEARKSRSLFEGKQAAVPVDVQQIQKAIEKIKAEEKAKEAAGVEAAKTAQSAETPKPAEKES